MSEMHLLAGDIRPATAGHLTYSADADVPSPLFPLGPNTLGEKLYPVTVDRTEERLRVGLSYQAPSVKLITDCYMDKLDELPNRERAMVEELVIRRADQERLARAAAGKLNA